MAVVLRLKRFGRLNYPTYRVCVADARFPRDGRVIETLGYYLPKTARTDDQVKLNGERVSHWLSVGAQPSETVIGLIKRAGIAMPERSKRVAARARPSPRPSCPPRRNRRKSRRACRPLRPRAELQKRFH